MKRTIAGLALVFGCADRLYLGPAGDAGRDAGREVEATDAPVVTDRTSVTDTPRCEANVCQSLGRSSGNLCNGSDLVECGFANGCIVEARRTPCTNGCNTSLARCNECAPNFCQDRGYRAGLWCDGDGQVSCGEQSGCGVIHWRQPCGSRGCDGGVCGECVDNWCQRSGQGTGTWCDGSDVVTCGMDGLCRIETSRMTCPTGCSGGACGMPTMTVFQQNYEDRRLFDDMLDGNQRFTDGEDFWSACGTSSVRFGTPAHQGTGALNLYCRCGGVPTNQTLSFPAMARADETLRLSFWAYNPFPNAVQVEAQRAGGPRVARMVPSQEWAPVSMDLQSSLNTGAAILMLGNLPDTGPGFCLRIDEVVITRF